MCVTVMNGILGGKLMFSDEKFSGSLVILLSWPLQRALAVAYGVTVEACWGLLCH